MEDTEYLSKPELKKTCEQEIKRLEKFFEIKMVKTPKVILVQDRKTINKLRKSKTPSWFVGWAEIGSIYLLSPEKFEKESNHKYSRKSYIAL